MGMGWQVDAGVVSVYQTKTWVVSASIFENSGDSGVGLALGVAVGRICLRWVARELSL